MEKVKILNIDINEDLSKYNEECFYKIKKDSNVYGILLSNGFDDSLIKKYIATCYQFYMDYFKWEKIKTMDDVISSGIYFKYKIYIDDNKELKRERDTVQPYKEYLDYQSKFIFKDYEQEFDDIKFSDVNNNRLKKEIVDELTKGYGIYLCGAPRSGKTFCAIALINGYARKGRDQLAFINSSLLVKQLNDLYFKNRTLFDERMEKLKNANILVLDGFGNEYVNDVVRDNIILPLLSERSKNKKITIFTSNLTIDEVSSLYGGKVGAQARSKQLNMLIRSIINKEIISSKNSLY